MALAINRVERSVRALAGVASYWLEGSGKRAMVVPAGMGPMMNAWADGPMDTVANDAWAGISSGIAMTCAPAGSSWSRITREVLFGSGGTNEVAHQAMTVTPCGPRRGRCRSTGTGRRMGLRRWVRLCRRGGRSHLLCDQSGDACVALDEGRPAFGSKSALGGVPWCPKAPFLRRRRGRTARHRTGRGCGRSRWWLLRRSPFLAGSSRVTVRALVPRASLEAAADPTSRRPRRAPSGAGSRGARGRCMAGSLSASVALA